MPIADPSNPGFFFPSGSHKIDGFETAVKGYVTDAWQTSLGYAYTDARITSATSTTIVPGNVVQLVPLQSVLVVEQVPVHPDLVGRGRRDLLLGFVRVVGRHASGCRASSASTPRSTRQINETWRAQLNVENIFNKGYWATADGNNNISPGQPRTVRLTATCEVLSPRFRAGSDSLKSQGPR